MKGGLPSGFGGTNPPDERKEVAECHHGEGQWDKVYKNHGEPGDTSADDVVRVHEEINSHGDDEGAEEDRGEIF